MQPHVWQVLVHHLENKGERGQSRSKPNSHLYHGNRPGTEDPSSARPRNHGPEGFVTQSNFPRCLLLFLASFLLL